MVGIVRGWGNGELGATTMRAWAAEAGERGLHRLEGREYVVKDGDVLLFKFNV